MHENDFDNIDVLQDRPRPHWQRVAAVAAQEPDIGYIDNVPGSAGYSGQLAQPLPVAPEAARIDVVFVVEKSAHEVQQTRHILWDFIKRERDCDVSVTSRHVQACPGAA